MTLEQVIELLRKKYNEALNLPFVFDPLAWALYYTWREVDEANRRTDNGKQT